MVVAFVVDLAQPGALLLIPRPCGDGSGALQPMLCEAGEYCNIFHFGPTYEREAAGGGRELVATAMATQTYTFGAEMGFDAASSDFDGTQP